MGEFSMPYQRERDNEDRKGPLVKELWRPLPNKEGMVHFNNVLLPLFTPHAWKMFNPTEEMRRKYRMCAPIPGSTLVGLDPSNPIYTFYFKLPIHQVDKFSRPDGSTGFASVLCPIGINKYLQESLGRGPLFEQPVRCAHCEESQRQWDLFNARWEALGIDKKALSADGYRDMCTRDPVLSVTKRAARDIGAQDKYFLAIFDHDKFVGARPLGEGDDPATLHQAWFAPKSVHSKLLRLFDGGAASGGAPQGLRFFENTPSGFPIISIVKDTSKCKKNNLRDTEYDAVFNNRFFQYSPEWIAYIQNYAALVDPTETLVHLVTYEEGLHYVSQTKSAGNDYQQAQQQMTGGIVPQGQPPQGQPPQGQPAYGAPMGSPQAAGWAGATGYPPVGNAGQTPIMPPPGMPAGLPPGSNPLGAPPGQPPMGQPQYGQAQPPAQQMPYQAPPAQAPQSAPYPGMAPIQQAPAPQYPAQQQYGTPPGQPPQGMPPGMPPGAPPAAQQPPQQYGQPQGQMPPGTPPMAGGAPPQGMPPMAPPPNMQPPQQSYGGAPVPNQPPAVPPPGTVPPIGVVPGFAPPPPDRAPTPPAEGAGGPPMRQW
jgi:hypothetical protein